jgi:hypothetical protein
LKIIFVVDEKNSALDISATQWGSLVGARIFSSNQFWSLRRLLERLISEQPDLVVFSWRQMLDAAFLSTKNLHLLAELQKHSRLLALVADHSAEEVNRWEKDCRLAQFGVGLVVVSKKLLNFYEGNGLTPIGILPDRPDAPLIRRMRTDLQNPRFQSVIWIGNSNWGKRHGFVDHKGLRSKFQVFLSKAEAIGLPVEAQIIDSAVVKLSQDEVFQKLATSELLMVTSLAEGTCLPILEALGMGTNVISTDVGVAQEFSTVTILPVDASPDDFLQAYINWGKHKFSREQCVEDFEKYIRVLDTSWGKLTAGLSTIPVVKVPLDEVLEVGFSSFKNHTFWALKFFVKWLRFVHVK